MTVSERPAPAALHATLRALDRTLKQDQLITDPDRLQAYAEDASGAGQYPPDAVVRAESTEDVQTVLRAASEHRIPVTPRGLGSGKSGGALPIYGGIVLSTEKMNTIREVNHADMLAVSGAGTITLDLMNRVEEEGLFYPPDPNSLNMCSIGGNVACNAGGPRALKYGVTKNYILGLKVVLPTGEVLDVGKRTIKHVTGYDLSALIVGSEGTLGVITEVTTRLVPKPRSVETALLSFASVEDAAGAVTRIFETGVTPRTLELLDEQALQAVRSKTPGRFPDNAGALIILETDSNRDEDAFKDLERAASACLDAGGLDVRVAQSEAQRAKIWEPRRILSTTLTESAPHKISEDISVPRSQIPSMLGKVYAIAKQHRIRAATYGHAGDGNLHVNILFEDHERESALKVVYQIMEATIGLGGTISGEHGIGLLKRDFMPLEQSNKMLSLQRALKRCFDPLGILNPGKVFPANGVRE